MEKPTEEFDFDRIMTTDSVRLLKPLIPYIPKAQQKMMILFIKAQEVMFLLKNFDELAKQIPQKSMEDLEFSDFRKYCTKEQESIIDQMESMKNAFKMYTQYSQMMNLMTPDTSDEGESDPDTSSKILNFLSEEQRELFEKFRNM